MSPVREGRNVPDLPQRMRAANYLATTAVSFSDAGPVPLQLVQ